MNAWPSVTVRLEHLTMIGFRLGAMLALAALCTEAQTTRGLLAGRIVDSRTLEPIEGATVRYENRAVNVSSQAASGSDGHYVIPLLPPGFYRVRVSRSGYQTLETQRLELRVASRVQLDVRLRPLSDVWEKDLSRSISFPDSSAVLTFYGPDVDTSRHAAFQPNPGKRGALEATVSEVIAPDTIRRLPFTGRDVYTMLITLPGVTIESSTGRGLGLAINGQRPASSNFLLDGVTNNNNLVSGPLNALPPEAIQEYRVSVSNFSAEYGGTSGYVANAVTRSGSVAWHGIGYGNFKPALNANTEFNIMEDVPKPRLSEQQVGFHTGGPVTSRLFVSAAFERLKSRGELEEVAVRVPAPNFVANFLRPGSKAFELFDKFPTPAIDSRDGIVSNLNVRPPVTIDRSLGLGRADYRSAAGRYQVIGRVSVSRLSRPDFIWTPYKDFVSGMNQPAVSAMFGLTTLPGPRWANELRIGWTNDDLSWERAHPEVPWLSIITTLQGPFDTIDDLSRVTLLPGSPALYAFANRGRSWELRENLTHVRERHVLKVGGAFHHRVIAGAQTTGSGGRYWFRDIIDFVLDRPSNFWIAISRTTLPERVAPLYDREYRQQQLHFFAHDTVRIGRRLVLNLGVRYEQVAAPRNVGSMKDILQPGSLVTPLEKPGSTQRFFSPANNWAGRFGFSYGFGGNSSTLLRGGYGIFHDRPFEDLWQGVRNNSVVVPLFTFARGSTSRLDVETDRTRFAGQPFADDFPRQLLLDPNLKTGYAQSFFLGLQRELSRDWSLEINGLGSLGRKLITTDTIARSGESSNRLIYRGNQGASRYQALTAVGRYRNPWGLLRLSYTWSQTWDHQSDPLAGEFTALSFTNYRRRPRPTRPPASFSLEGNNSADWGNADFEQRHNLVVFSHWDLPPAFSETKLAPLFRDWRFAQIAALRSGFPFTVRALARGSIINQRADLIAPDRAKIGDPIPGGKRLLNAAAFGQPADGELGNSGRNAFPGPGFYNIDVAVSRVFRPQWLGEGRRIEVRADVFNVLNHSNLNQPDSLLGSPTFGQALRGRVGPEAGFPALTPLDETPRQIQLIVRFEF